MRITDGSRNLQTKHLHKGNETFVLCEFLYFIFCIFSSGFQEREKQSMQEGKILSPYNFVSNCNPIEKLNEMEAVIKVPTLVESIAKRKAELAKDMDGEILLGEVPKPSREKEKGV